jgi:hypothetical protein
MVRLVPDAGCVNSVCVVGITCGQVLQLLQGRLTCKGWLGYVKFLGSGKAVRKSVSTVDRLVPIHPRTTAIQSILYWLLVIGYWNIVSVSNID